MFDKDEIIEMAIQAGLLKKRGLLGRCSDSNFEAFAKLVAAKEREACANVCDKASAVSLPAFLAMQIRARGEA